jgi:hypothetical protein
VSLHSNINDMNFSTSQKPQSIRIIKIVEVRRICILSFPLKAQTQGILKGKALIEFTDLTYGLRSSVPRVIVFYIKIHYGGKKESREGIY